MSNTFHIKNFDRLQHYKDRSPPWIKLYNGLLDDYDFARLPDASKAHLLAIGLLASRYNNKIPLDAEWISRRINATDPIDLSALIKSGFIVPDQDCSNLLSDCLQVAIPERERQVRDREEKREIRSAAPQEVLALDDPVMIVFPTNKSGERYQVLKSQFETYQSLYPALDMAQELRSMAAWLISNPKNAKTYGGIPKFINSWLSTNQNKSGAKINGRSSKEANWRAGAERLQSDIQSGSFQPSAERGRSEIIDLDAARVTLLDAGLHGKPS